MDNDDDDEYKNNDKENSGFPIKRHCDDSDDDILRAPKKGSPLMRRARSPFNHSQTHRVTPGSPSVSFIRKPIDKEPPEHHDSTNDSLRVPKKGRPLMRRPQSLLNPSQTHHVTPGSPSCSFACKSIDPETPERRFWRPLKERLIDECSVEGLTSPRVREIYRKTDPGGFFESPVKFKGKTVFQADMLFNPDDVVLSRLGIWETNRQRMERGACPVGHKGIFTGDRTCVSDQEVREIRDKQRRYRIELQHVTQKDTGLEDDPICEMTHDAHMGEDTWHIIEERSRKVVVSSLKKEEALSYLELRPDCIMVANILHFREGDSLINRSAFASWRMVYWKNRANQLGKRTDDTHVRKTLFCSPVVSDTRIITPDLEVY